jgi:WD40 repeat protein
MDSTRTRRVVMAAVLLGAASLPAAGDEPAGKLPPRWYVVPPAPAAPFARDVRLSADGKRLVVGWSTGARVFDLTTGRSVTLHDDKDKGVSARISPDGRWVVGVRGAEPDWQLVVWDAATGKEVRAEPVVSRKPTEYWRPAVLGFDGDSAAWVVRSAGVVDRVELPRGRVTRSIRLPFDAGSWGRVVLSPDGRWLALGGGTVFAVRRTDADADWVVVEKHAEADPSEDLPQPTTCPIPCGFSPDGRRLVTYDRKGEVVALWDLAGKPTRVKSRPAGLTPWTHLDDLTFTPDGKRFAFVLTPKPQDRFATELRVWDAETLAEVTRLAPPNGVEGFAFVPPGKTVLLAHPDGTLSVREWAGGK